MSSRLDETGPRETPLRLSVNLNKVALLRNSRGAANPSPRRAAELVLGAGAQGLTLHWREDERHARAEDIRELRGVARDRGAEFNLEGDPRPAIVDLALELQVDQLTLVPVSPGEITSDHGWDLPRREAELAPAIERARARGVRVSLFMDVGAPLREVAALGADRVELYTEPYASAFHGPGRDAALGRLAESAAQAHALGLGVNAGHDLDLSNLPSLARAVPQLAEVSIGHALIADALYLGLEETIARYLRACRGEPVEIPRTS
ncbi:MAG: pyridoxine 5'-phosphate synthase [Myxococcales bacterium]|nr:pyridoxine 5'-phosphate synthase [Myxococcales bacterium]